MRQSLNKLVNNMYTGKQKLQVKEVIRETRNENIDNDQNHLLNYSVLAIALEDHSERELTDVEVEEFYNLQDGEWLTEVDSVIANVIYTLSKIANNDVKVEYENALVLDNTQPEFDYLVNEVEKVLVNLN